MLSGREGGREERAAEEGRVRTSDLRSGAPPFPAAGQRSGQWRKSHGLAAATRFLPRSDGRKFAASMICNKQPCGSREALCELCASSLGAKTRR